MEDDCKKSAEPMFPDDTDAFFARVPSWLRSKESDPPLWIVLEEDGFFDKLEDVGGHALSHIARCKLAIIVGAANAEAFDRRHKEEVIRKQKLNAKVAEFLANQIEEDLNSIHFYLRHPMTELPLRLREYAQQQYPCIPQEVMQETLFDTSGPDLSSLLLNVREAQEELEVKEAKTRGARPKEYNDRVIEQLAELYHQIGGPVAVGGGGFSRFLSTTWEVLPGALRCKTAAEFVRRARNYERQEKGLPRLRSLVKGLPRDLTEKGSAKG